MRLLHRNSENQIRHAGFTLADVSGSSPGFKSRLPKRTQSRLSHRNLFFRTRNARGNLLNDFLIDAAGGQLLAHADCVFDGLAVGPAVANQTIAAYAQQRRAAVFLPIMLLVNLLHHRLELLQKLRRIRFKLGNDRLKQTLGQAFGELQDGIADESIADHHVDHALEQVAPFDVAHEIDQRLIPHQFAGVFHHLRSLGVFLADGEKPDARILDAADGAWRTRRP